MSTVARYSCGMVIVAPIFVSAALAATLVPQAGSPVFPERQASATVTILRSARLRFSDIEKDQPESLRQSVVRKPDGSTETMRLVEFQ